MLSAVLLFGLSLCHFDLTLNRLLGSLIFICRIGGKRVAILIDLVIMHICGTYIFTANGVEAETNLGTFGIDDDLLVFGINGNNLADYTADGNDLGARLKIGTKILALGLPLGPAGP